jgi:dolichol-phosphate mannosyltransferase
MKLNKMENVIISVIVPTLNEANNIEQTSSRLVDLFESNFLNYEIIFVDDQSTDGTIQRIHEFQKLNKNIKLIISQNKNGIGNALTQGTIKAIGEYIIFVDADNSVENSFLLKMINLRDKNSLIIGSRYIKMSKIYNVNKIKIILSKILNKLIARIFKINALDISHSLRIFPKKNFQVLNNLQHPIFFWEQVVLMKKNNIKIIEIPIIFYERKTDKTKNSFFL